MEKKVVKKSTLPTSSYYSKPFGTCWLQSSLHYLYRHFYDDIMKADPKNIVKNMENKISERCTDLQQVIEGLKEDLKNKRIESPYCNSLIANHTNTLKNLHIKPGQAKELIKSIQDYFKNSSQNNLFKIAEKFVEYSDKKQILEGKGYNPHSFLANIEEIIEKKDIMKYSEQIDPANKNPIETYKQAVALNKDIFFEPYCEGQTASSPEMAEIGVRENNTPGTQHVIFCENLGNGEFKLHDNIKPEQTKIVDSSFFEKEFSKLQYAKNHHECLNDYSYMNIKYRNREKMIDGLSGKGAASILIGDRPSNYQKNEKKRAYVLKNGRTTHSKSVDCKYHTQTGLKKIQTNKLMKLIDQSKTELDALTRTNKMMNELRNYVYSDKFNLGLKSNNKLGCDLKSNNKLDCGLKSNNKLDCDLKSTVDKAFGRGGWNN